MSKMLMLFLKVMIIRISSSRTCFCCDGF